MIGEVKVNSLVCIIFIISSRVDASLLSAAAAAAVYYIHQCPTLRPWGGGAKMDCGKGISLTHTYHRMMILVK